MNIPVIVMAIVSLSIPCNTSSNFVLLNDGKTSKFGALCLKITLNPKFNKWILFLNNMLKPWVTVSKLLL